MEYCRWTKPFVYKVHNGRPKSNCSMYIFSEYHYEGGSPNIEYGIIDFESKNDTLKLFWKETDFHFSPDIFDSGWFPKVLLIKKKKLIPVVNNNLVKYMKFKLVK